MTIASPAISASISKDGRTATVSVPVNFLQRGGRRQILSPPGAAPWTAAPRVDSALIKAVVRAHRWRQMLESGEYAASAELAKAHKVNDSYLSRILRLTLIAPDIIEATGRKKTDPLVAEVLAEILAGVTAWITGKTIVEIEAILGGNPDTGSATAKHCPRSRELVGTVIPRGMSFVLGLVSHIVQQVGPFDQQERLDSDLVDACEAAIRAERQEAYWASSGPQGLGGTILFIRGFNR